MIARTAVLRGAQARWSARRLLFVAWEFPVFHKIRTGI
jgi:hypothetical protein